MKLSVKIKLDPSAEQHSLLKETMECFNNACNYISDIAFDTKSFNKFKLQSSVYYDVKNKFNLSSQMVIRAISKVVESYKRDKKVKHQFKKHGAVTYDQRILSYKGLDKVSLWTLLGRQVIPMVLGGYQKSHIARVKGQSDLIYKNGVFYLVAVVDVKEQPELDYENVLGIDLGIINLATTSDGETFSGSIVEQCRTKLLKLRSSLQKAGTQSAKRHLRKISKKEHNFRTDVNHVISKKIVEKAKHTNSAVILENLKGIRKARVRKSQQAQRSSWSFYQLKTFILYKAKIAGITTFEVNPANTSRECFKCKHVDKNNRKSQSEFKCIKCKYLQNADINAAMNIATRASVNMPIVSNQISGLDASQLILSVGS